VTTVISKNKLAPHDAMDGAILGPHILGRHSSTRSGAGQGSELPTIRKRP